MNKFELPTPEQQEPTLEKQVIDAFRTRGKEDPEALNLLNRWLDEEQQKVNEINTSEATLELNIKLARLYRDAGLREESMRAFEDAHLQAANEGKNDTVDQLIDEIEELERLGEE